MTEPGEFHIEAALTADTGVTHLANGEVHVEAVVLGHEAHMSPRDVQELSAHGRGIDPDNLELRTPDGEMFAPARNAGRVSMGYMGNRWRSSWDPDAERAAAQGDPSLN